MNKLDVIEVKEGKIGKEREKLRLRKEMDDEEERKKLIERIEVREELDEIGEDEIKVGRNMIRMEEIGEGDIIKSGKIKRKDEMIKMGIDKMIKGERES